MVIGSYHGTSLCLKLQLKINEVVYDVCLSMK